MLKEQTALICYLLRTIPLGCLYDPEYNFREEYAVWRQLVNP